MKIFRKKFPKPKPPEAPDNSHKRRVATIVRDERGTASVEWKKAPKDYERQALEVEDTGVSRNSKVRGGLEVMHIKNEESFNPYERTSLNQKKPGAKPDLRKLSEYIKMMRELEERKKRGEDD